MGNPEAGGHQQAQEYELPNGHDQNTVPPAYAQSQPVVYPPPPQSLRTNSAQPVQYPPPSPLRSPAYHQVTAQTSPMMYPPQATVGYQAPPVVQYQNMGPQGQYVHTQNAPATGFPVQSPDPKAVQLNAWSSGLFDCMNDPMNALITACFPCLTFGQLAEIVDEGHTSCGTSGLLYAGIAICVGLPCIMSCTYRTKLRSKFNLPEAPAPDWITHCLCEWCAICQEYRELQSRGWDPSIGWQGNLARNQNMNRQQATMMAPMDQRMMD